MSKNKMLTPMVEQWPSWFGRLRFPDTDVTATYADGILEVRVPTRTEADRSKKVTVTRG